MIMNYDEFLEITKFLPAKDIMKLCKTSKDIMKFCKTSKLFAFVLVYKRGWGGKMKDVIGVFSSHDSAKKEMFNLFKNETKNTMKNKNIPYDKIKKHNVEKSNDKIEYDVGDNTDSHIWEIYTTKKFN